MINKIGQSHWTMSIVAWKVSPTFPPSVALLLCPWRSRDVCYRLSCVKHIAQHTGGAMQILKNNKTIRWGLLHLRLGPEGSNRGVTLNFNSQMFHSPQGALHFWSQRLTARKWPKQTSSCWRFCAFLGLPHKVSPRAHWKGWLFMFAGRPGQARAGQGRAAHRS